MSTLALHVALLHSPTSTTTPTEGGRVPGQGVLHILQTTGRREPGEADAPPPPGTGPPSGTPLGCALSAPSLYPVGGVPRKGWLPFKIAIQQFWTHLRLYHLLPKILYVFLQLRLDTNTGLSSSGYILCRSCGHRQSSQDQ
ncbi:hypothetical protein LEMLEM_LOCUS26587 [Lemmus lemmus]